MTALHVLADGLIVRDAIGPPGLEVSHSTVSRIYPIKTLQKFASVHASIHNHFNQDRHLNHRDIFKQNRAAALAEWCELMA